MPELRQWRSLADAGRARGETDGGSTRARSVGPNTRRTSLLDVVHGVQPGRQFDRMWRSFAAHYIGCPRENRMRH